MNLRSLIILILVASVAIVLILTVQLSRVENHAELRERIRTYHAVHRVQMKQLENLYRTAIAYLQSENPRILKALHEMERVIQFQQTADNIIQSMVKHRNEPDSVSHYFIQYKSFVNSYQPLYDTLRASFSGLDNRPVQQILMPEKLFGREPSLLKNNLVVPDGDIVYIGVLNLQSDLNNFTLSILWSLGAIADASAIQYPADQKFSLNEHLLYTDCPATMFKGKTERVLIQFSGQALAYQYLTDFSSKSDFEDHLATNGRLTMNLIANTKSIEIKPLQHTDQYVSYIGYGIWEFDVTPIKTGRDTLYFRTDASKFKPPVKGEFSIPEYQVIIDVQ
jgi:hypothetical protein